MNLENILWKTLRWRIITNKIIIMLDEKDYKYKKLIHFLNLSKVNLIWYIKNSNNIIIYKDYIYLNGIYFYLDDLYIEWNNVDIWNYKWKTYFTYNAAIREINKIGKRLLWKNDWKNLIDFLPGNIENKIIFLKDILWLSFFWFKCRDNWFYCNFGNDWWYWSLDCTETHAYNLHISKNIINFNDLEFKDIWFLVRCIK